MQNFKIAAAQIPSEKENIDANIQVHIQAVKTACMNDVSIIFFPELSITGYELEFSAKEAFEINDNRFDVFQNLAIENNIHIVIGAALKTDNIPELGAIIFSPDGSISSYSKIHLHSGESKYFKPGRTHKFLEVDGQKIALAICADTNYSAHAKACAQESATIYAAGVLFSKTGYAPDTNKLASYAKQHNMLVTIANHNRNTGGWLPAGMSAAWSQKGLLSKADQHSNSLVISQNIDNTWVSEVFEM